MESPSDRDKKRKRRTSCELFFEEDNVFSDLEEEKAFLQETFVSCEDQAKQKHKNDLQTCSELTNNLLKLCCGKCDCCKIMQEVLGTEEKWPLSLSASDCQSDVKPNQFETQLAGTSRELNTSQNILPNGITSRNKGVKCINHDDENSNSKKNNLRKQGRPRKGNNPHLPNSASLDMQSEDTASMDTKEDNMGKLLEEFEERRNSLSGVKRRRTLEVRFSNATCNTRSSEQNIITDYHPDDDYKLSSSDQKMEKKSEHDKNTLARKTKSYGTQECHKENSEQHSSRNSKSLVRKKSARSRRSLLDTHEVNQDPSSATSSAGMVTSEDYEPRRSSREPKPCQKYSEDYCTRGLENKRKSGNFPKSMYHNIDRRVFKMPIDTTFDRGFTRAIARKLARRAGFNLNAEQFTIQHETFRSKPPEKIKKLYSPENWLNSRNFKDICDTSSGER